MKKEQIKRELIKFAEWFAKDTFEIKSLNNDQKQGIKNDIERYFKSQTNKPKQ